MGERVLREKEWWEKSMLEDRIADVAIRVEQ
jgi:hypothetical protein